MIRRILGALILIAAAVLFRSAFRGEYAFNRRPSLILAPIYTTVFEGDRIVEVRGVLERELAATGRHALYPKSLIENFYLERDNATDVFDGSYRGKDESLELGRALGVERVAIASVLRFSGQLNLHLSVYDVETDQVVGRAELTFADEAALLSWTRPDGTAADLDAALGMETPGLSVGAWLYLGWMGLSALVGLLLAAGLTLPRILVEILLGIGLMLALFSWIYALNGDMDYVQRFVATSGLLQLEDTRHERTATALRYLAPMLLLSIVLVLDILARRRAGGDLIDATAPIWAGFSALLYAFSLPNILVLEGLPILAWVATVPLYIALRRVHYGRGVFLSLIFVGVQALLVNWWQGTFSYVSLPFTVGLTLAQFLPFALLLAFTVRRFPRWGLLAAPFFWTAFDWARSLGFLGYPWGLLGVSQYASPALIQGAALGGVWLVSLLPHLTGAAAAWTIERRDWRPAAAALGAVALVAALGALDIELRDRREEGRTVRILLVQQNTDPRKHDYRLSFEELSRLTEEALAVEGPFDLVAWPESGFVPDIRFWLDESRSRWRRGKLVREFLEWQADTGIPLVTGNQDHFYEPAPPSEDPEAPEEVKRIQNSAVYLAPDRSDDFDRAYYYKIRLVPFTENFPYREEFPWVAELLHNFSTTQWTPGADHTVLQAPRFGFSTPICFEDVFPNHLRQFALAGAEVFVNMSNDYWANTPLEGYQHAAHAVFRAVENRRPLVRATCSGWTISVDAEGRIAEGWPPFYTPGWTVAEHVLPDRPPTTLYMRFGDWLPILCAAIWIGLVCAEALLRRRGSGPPAYERADGPLPADPGE